MSMSAELISSTHRRDARYEKEADGPFAKTAFTVFKDQRSGTRLGLRFANGEMRSLPYSHLLDTHFGPAGQVLLNFSTHRVIVSGRNLQALHFRIEEESVCEIFERHDYHDLEPAEATERERWEIASYVEAISIEPI